MDQSLYSRFLRATRLGGLLVLLKALQGISTTLAGSATPNQTPEVVNLIPSRGATVGTSFSLTIPPTPSAIPTATPSP